MKTNVKTCLFGGALIGAGLCSPVSAADVNWNFGSGRANNFASSSFDSNTGPYASWDAYNSYDSHSVGGTFGLDLFADGAPTGGAYAYSFGTFSVETNTTLLLSWDIADSGNIGVIALGAGVHILSETTGDSGSLVYTFLATETYYVSASMFDDQGDPSFFTMGENTVNVVPLPPAAFGGLAMLAGLGAYRRIRK